MCLESTIRVATIVNKHEYSMLHNVVVSNKSISRPMSMIKTHTERCAACILNHCRTALTFAALFACQSRDKRMDDWNKLVSIIQTSDWNAEICSQWCFSCCTMKTIVLHGAVFSPLPHINYNYCEFFSTLTFITMLLYSSLISTRLFTTVNGNNISHINFGRWILK